MRIAVTDDIATCRALRRVVFIEEQGVSEADELDDLDGVAVHLLAIVDGRPMGSARIIPGEGYGKIGRVCVLAEARGTGLGAALMREAVQECRRLGLKTARLGAQTHALGFYEALGFEAVGPVFDDAGIPHREMILTL
ncbi:MAG: GNAT family N-acetyltransferase [Rhodobacteraceae bacterium]|nr:GNAT family N-acetyltransferase [Paracoccaceae bacterium]